MASQLTDKVALVLGAGKANNLGQAIAARFAAEGAKVMVSGRDTDELRRFANDISGAFQPADITSPVDLEALVTATVSHFGALHIAVSGRR